MIVDASVDLAGVALSYAVAEEVGVVQHRVFKHIPRWDHALIGADCRNDHPISLLLCDKCSGETEGQWN